MKQELGIVSRLRKGLEYFSGSKRRDMLGTDVNIWDPATGYYRTRSVRLEKTALNPISRKDSWYLLDRAKMYLAARIPSQELIDALDVRREWNQENRPISTVLDLFPSLKYSYSSFLPVAHLIAIPLNMKIKNFLRQTIVTFNISLALANSRNCYKKTVNLLASVQNPEVQFFDGVKSVSSFGDSSASNSKPFKSRGRVEDVARSHNYRLDPVEAPKELLKYQLRIAEVKCPSLSNNF